MEMRHLRYFIAVAEEEHMTRAAQRLGIQQPPLSQQIRDLERELGVQLFDRTPRSVRLNTAGRVFLEDARALVAGAERAALRVQQATRGQVGRIAVGYTSSASLHPRVPQLIRAFHASHPMIALDSQENTTRDLLEAVAGEALDAVFVRASARRYPTLSSLVLDQEPMVVAVPIEHRLAGKRGALALADLAAEPFILYRREDGPGVQDELLAACAKAGFTPRVVADVPRLLSAVTLVASGRGITLLPRTLQVLHQESVVYRPLHKASAFTIPLTLVYRAPPADAPLARFVDAARQTLPAPREQGRRAGGSPRARGRLD
ncbi:MULTISPECIES: LysR family transcriptional regulator [unclassified Achromobacter]|uniref:LysR family transcriptional regulator n=1 Tax=unclassified Achromobacter TaxID=2626865 RepID=UPI000B5168E2|nr:MULTISPECIES: LysR family transcriptional regulator [unclassified Achromobacter]OWT75508.1 LysR family transcriptional regulator [Achromobacter sp. HZ28]OWT76168.1 LysR family transcriptional regulator [Achromobacter sp. HZ34]